MEEGEVTPPQIKVFSMGQDKRPGEEDKRE